MANEVDNSTGVPLYGFPGNDFFIIQYTALATLPTTTIISTGVLIYILKPCRKFFSQPLADRLIVYLMFCDLCHSVGLIVNHGLMLALVDHPAMPICLFLSFWLAEFLLAQTFVILYAAFNSFVTVVVQKKLVTGKYDWRLLAFIIGVPTVIGIAGVTSGSFGPSGAWCYMQRRTPGGRILGTTILFFMVATVIFIMACYSGVWLKIRQAAAVNKSDKYHKTARAMFLMVVAFIAQWWAAIVYGIWGMIEPPPLFVMVTNVVFSNLGGLFNFIAYVFIRKMKRRVSNSGNESTRTITLFTQN